MTLLVNSLKSKEYNGFIMNPKQYKDLLKCILRDKERQLEFKAKRYSDQIDSSATLKHSAYINERKQTI